MSALDFANTSHQFQSAPHTRISRRKTSIFTPTAFSLQLDIDPTILQVPHPPKGAFAVTMETESSSFLPLPTKTPFGKAIIYINLPCSTALYVLAMCYPSLYDAMIPEPVRAFAPWPRLSLWWFFLSVWILPIVAIFYEYRVVVRKRKGEGFGK